MAQHQRIEDIRQLEGRPVSLALADGSRIDNCTLVSAGRGQARTMWVFIDGIDAFIHQADVLAVWEAATTPTKTAA